jgi:predicted DNA binding CopG/RHH family protein
MRKMKLTRAEQWIEDHAEEFVPVSSEQFELFKQAIERRKKDMVLNIRVNSWDMAQLKEKARKAGIKYQTFITEILHKVAQIE